MLDLKTLAGDRYRITLDPSAEGEPRSERCWYYRIPGQSTGGRTSFISVHGPGMLAAWSNRRQIVRRLESLPGVCIHQRGDDEIRILFAVDRLEEVATIIRARRRPQMSEAQRRASKERLSRFQFSRTSSA
jgi:hypothetical protein